VVVFHVIVELRGSSAAESEKMLVGVSDTGRTSEDKWRLRRRSFCLCEFVEIYYRTSLARVKFGKTWLNSAMNLVAGKN
jgi:hypothetical protein